MNNDSLERENDTVRRRLQKYERFQRLDLYLGGGLGGLLLFGELARDVFVDAPQWLRPLFITLALSTALCIGFAYSGFEWAQTKLKRTCEDTSHDRQSPITDAAPNSWPPHAFLLQKSAPVFLGLTATLLLIAAWWPYARGAVYSISSFLVWLGDQISCIVELGQ